MLYEVLQYLRVLNYDSGMLVADVMRGEFVIEGGAVELPLMNGQHYVISGSVFNDGVHVYPSDVLEDERFTGVIHALRLPKALLDIVAQMEEEAGKTGVSNGFASESFGGYSYTRATDSKGRTLDMIRANADRLAPWRML